MQLNRAVIVTVLIVVAPLLAVQPATAQTPPTCDGLAATMVGTVGDDLLLGTDGQDVIVGLEGDDVIYGFAGRDVLCGGPGRDELFGGRSSDTLHGGDQSDRLKGDAGNDHLFGDRGNDRLIGGNGNDELVGGNGRIDRLSGRGGIDTCLDNQTTTIVDTCELPALERKEPIVDFNGDGFADLAIGVPGEKSNGKTNGGAVSVIYGGLTGLSAKAVVADQLWDQHDADVEGDVEANERFGRTLTVADFNNDGFSDLAVGVPFEDVAGVSGAGAVNVIYGSSIGLSATAALPDQLWNQNSAGVEGEAETLDQFGDTLTSTDLNNDGFDDLIIGVPFEDVGSLGDAGAFHVIYGSNSGLSTTTALPDQFWDQSSPGLNGEAESGDKFAATLTVDDFNNDGFGDLAVGVPLENVEGVSGAGAVNVIYGSSNGLSATAVLNAQFWHQNSPGVESDAESFDLAGWSLAGGDYNNDGFGDLAFGVRGETIDQATDAGAVNVIYGSFVGLSTTATLPDQFWHENSPGVDGVAEQSDRLGWSLTSGDFNDDGFSDLAIGVITEDIGLVVDAGAVLVIYGSEDGLSTTNVLPDQLWTQDVMDEVPDEESEETSISGLRDHFGRSIMGADFNGDGATDLAVGASGETIGDEEAAGAVNLIYGSFVGLSTSAELPNQHWNQNSSDVQDDADDGDLFGWTLGAR